MNQTALYSVYRFSTEDLPLNERFDAWSSQFDGMLNIIDLSESQHKFNIEMEMIQIGRFMFGRRAYLNSVDRSAPCKVQRTMQQTRTDGLDYYNLQLHLNSMACGFAAGGDFRTHSNDLVLFDCGRPLDFKLEMGEVIFINIPRDFFAKDLRSGKIISGSLAYLLADFMLSLGRQLSHILPADLQHVARVLVCLLSVCIKSTEEEWTQTELSISQKARVNRYIDAHLFDPGLDVGRICRDVGISRSAIYRLYESTNGIAHTIQRARLRRAYNTLADPISPKIRVAEIARRYGFKNEKQFSRAFKEAFGHSPRDTHSRLYVTQNCSASCGAPIASPCNYSDYLRQWSALSHLKS